MVSFGVVDSNVPRIVIQFEYLVLLKRQNGEWNVRNFRGFLFGMSPDVQVFKVRVLESDFRSWIGVNGY